MRKLLFLGLSVIYMLIMTFCEYTPTVINHITDEDNYIEIETTVVSVEYHESGYSYIYITLNDFEHYEGFFGSLPESEDDSVLKSSVAELKIVPQNVLLLKEAGFFDGDWHGKQLRIATTCWINNTISHHYVAAVAFEDGEYLSFEQGFEGICDASVTLKEIEFDKIINQKKVR